MSVSPARGRRKEVLLKQGPIRYCERGEGQPIVFIHPMVVNGDLWRKVVPLLAGEYRCITPDWPLGGHDVPMTPGCDLSPPGIARIVAGFLEELDLEGVTLVGNDTGGAIAQIVAADFGERLSRLALVTCDAFDNFPPKLAKPLVWLTYVNPLIPVAAKLARRPRLQRMPFFFGWLTKRRIDQEVVDSYLSPLLANPAVRWDAVKALRRLAPRYTLAAAEKLPTFDKPALVAWSTEDHFFPFEHARRLAELLPNSRLLPIVDAHTFVPEDQPDVLAAALRELISGGA